MPNRRGVTVGAAVAGVGYSAGLLLGWGSDSFIRIVSDIGFVGFALFATVCSVLAARRCRGRERLAWASMSVGAAGWMLGGIGWAVFRLSADQAPLPWWSSVGYLLFLAGAALCLVLLLTAHVPGAQLRLLLDGLILGAALFVLAWVVVFGDVYQARVAEPSVLALSLVFPVGDIALLAMAILLLLRASAAYRTELSLLTIGLTLITISNTVFTYLAVTGDVSGRQAYAVGWVLGLLGIGLAALVIRDAGRSEVTDGRRAPSRTSVWLPYVPVLAAAVLCTPVLIAGHWPVFTALAVAVLAVMIRQFLVLEENRRLLVEAADHALRDPLTGLANRTLFSDRLRRAVALHGRRASTVGVLLLDLDRFKLVNDSLGQPAGDAMLVRVSERLAGTVRSGDVVARLGGDEFAVLVEGDADDCNTVAQRVTQAFERPFVIGGRDLLVRPSVGLALAEAEVDVDAGIDTVDDAEDHTEAVDADELLRRAGVAMEAAKSSRWSRLCTYSPGVGQGADHDANVVPGAEHLLAELRHAIEHFELSVFFQPKFDIRKREIVGLEALIRWPHPERGLLTPHQFLPLVRQHGLMRAMTAVVLELALDEAAGWYRQGVGMPVAVNVFAPAIGDPDLPDHIMEALQSRGLSPQALTVEVTEDLLLDNMGRARSVFNRLRDNGIRVAIDDFGSGYSALWYLREFPVDEIKLGKEFIAPVLTNPASAVIVRSVFDLAHALGITAVAEGVENAQTAQRLLEFGCDVAQGYHYSRPLPATQVLDLLKSQHRGTIPAPGYSAPDGSKRSDIELMQ